MQIIAFGRLLLLSGKSALTVAAAMALPITAQTILAVDDVRAATPGQASSKSISAAPVEKDDPAKFFLFYKGDLPAEQVRADLVYCIEQAKPIISLRDQTPNTAGLLGALINGRMAEIDRFRMRNAAMRKCMGLMGYERYSVAPEFWRTTVKNGDIVQDDEGLVDPEVVERMVAFATGPTPMTPRLQP